MKTSCKIEVKSTRDSILDREFSPDTEEDFWDQVEEEGILPEELYETDTTDRTGDALYMEPDLPEPNESVLNAYGIAERTDDGSWRISYEDSEITGLPGCLTTFCLVPDGSVILLRRGEVRTCMIFRRGTRQVCEYSTDGSVPSVVLHTHELEWEMGDAGGRLYVNYSVEMRGTVVEQNAIDLSVWMFDKDKNL